MKTLILPIQTIKEKELVLKLVLVSTLALTVMTQSKNKATVKAQPVELADMYVDTFGDFDQVPIAHKPEVVSELIASLKPNLSKAKRVELAKAIKHTMAKYNIPPQVVLAIIDTESGFNHELVSSTGDYSLAQINVNIWNKEFERLKMPLIDLERLQADQVYSLEMMGQILNLLKKRHAKTDRRWYARYHSKTQKYKHAYLSKMELRMVKMSKKFEMSSAVAYH